MSQRLVTTCLLSFTFGAAALAAQVAADEIYVGGVRLRLGTQASVVLESLRDGYDVQDVWGSSPSGQEVSVPSNANASYVVARVGEPQNLLANIIFREGILTHVRRYWSLPDQRTDSPAFADAVLSALDQLDGIRCRIDVTDGHTPEMDGRTAVIACGNRRVEIRSLEFGRDRTAQVDEVLGE